MTPEPSPGLPPREQDGVQAGLPRTWAVSAEPRRPVEFDAEPPSEPPPRSTAFLGREIVERAGRPIWGTLFLLIASAIVGLGLWHRVPALAISLPPPFFILACAMFRPVLFPTRYRFTEEGIVSGRGGETLHYSDIQDVFAPFRDPDRQFPIVLFLAEDCLEISKKINVPSIELYNFLRSQPLGRREVNIADLPSRFEQFLKQQLLVSPRRIYVFRGTKKRSTPQRRRYRRAGWWFVALAAIWLTLAPLAPATPVNYPLTAMALLFGSIFLVGGYTFFGYVGMQFKNWRDVVLIITPQAMAMQQDDLCGELRWHELVSVKPQGASFGLGDSTALHLKAQGASIIVHDIFQWPLRCAAELIKGFSGK